MKQGQFPAVISLASLNGRDGFKIDGEGGYSGYSVSNAGDVNRDGYADLLIGAYNYGNNVGRSYLVFGGPGVGASGLLKLTYLNGTNGIKFDGEAVNDACGLSLSAAGDINNDGYADIIIGAQGHTTTGRSYVVFGGPKIGSNSLLPLSTLTGTNGFKLDGEAGSYSGSWVSAAGDVNSDGYADLLIGAFSYNSQTGRSYVVFGGPGVGSSGLISLSSLTGTNGFKIDGEATLSNSGWRVGAAGDINADGHADFFIGSPVYSAGGITGSGRSYVVFGGVGIGSSGLFSLSGLTGTNGFKLDGELYNSDQSGDAISSAGDFNGDGIMDLVIGAPQHTISNDTGRSYVIFGGLGIGSGGLFQLSGLNGVNGFKLDGGTNSGSGRSVSMAGDVNGDGHADLIIGAVGASCSYLVFGGPGVGSNGFIPLSALNGSNGFRLDGESITDYSGNSVSVAGDVNGDGVVDVIIGAYGHNNSIGRSYVVFGDIPPVLVNNRLQLFSGATVRLSATYLSAYDRNHNNNTLVFVPSAIQHGYFSTVSTPGIPIVNFTQQQITNGTIQFVHDGTQNPPSYNVSVYSTGIAWVGPSPAKITFILSQGHFPAVLPLASLNGQNGFKLSAEAVGDYFGMFLSSAGDINKDGYADILITASYHSPVPRSYVIFGGPQVGKQGLLNVSTLNGINGFKLDCESAGQSVVDKGGDINSDGYNDFFIADWDHSGVGRLYVIFGGHKVNSSALLLLSNLNGVNGFKLDGTVTNGEFGRSAVSPGDINGDGHMDILAGSSTGDGRSYVVFGGPGVGSSGTFSVSSLNGANGFTLPGEVGLNSLCGYSVSGAGDINNDGYSDLLIGAFYLSSSTGRSYVVFGGPGVGSSGSVSLSSLNGNNGFKLDGEVAGDDSGYSVSTAGDINGDGYADMIIGSLGHNNSIGRSYIIFGGVNVGSSGSIPLLTLNGMNGFKIDGEKSLDSSGSSVSTAGDINGDGYTDFLIGAYNHGSGTGRTYVIFGSPTIGQGGLLPLTTLNGLNGFKLDGEVAGDESGTYVNAAGDVNGDGVADFLIGSSDYNASPPRFSRGYVIFGDIPPVLVNNQLQLTSGATVRLNSTYLFAYDRNHNNNTLVFVPINITHGHFELISQPGIPLVNFTQPQLINSSVQFVHDSSSVAPSYHINVYSPGIAWAGPVTANITFFLATSTPAITITAMPTTVTPTHTFTSSTIIASPTLTPTPTSTPTVTPTPALVPIPVLLNNQLTLSDGETVVLSSTNLQAVEAGFNSSSLTFYVSNVQNGYFSLLPTNASVTRFLQSYVQNGQVQFVHSGDHQAPSYSIVVSDGSQATAPNPALIDFLGAPTVVTSTPVTVTQGGSTTLTTSNLNVSNTGGSSPSQIVFQVSNVQQGQFILNSTGAPVSNFTLTQLLDHTVQLVQDNSNIAPSYSISATSNNGLSSAPTPVTAQLCNSLTSSLGCAPKVVRNNLWVKQGTSSTITTQNLYATDSSGQSLPASTVYYVTNVNHGYFDVNGSSSSYFTQQQLQSGVVQFVDDGTNVAPSYQIAVQSSNLQTNSLAQVTLSFVNKPPYLAAGGLLNQVAVVGQPFSLAITSSTFVDPQNDPLILSAGIYNSTQLLPSWLSFNPSTNRFSGIPTDPGVLDIGVTASDPEGLSTVGEFSLTVLGPSATSNNSLTTAIASSVVSGTIGLFFLLLKIGLQRAASKKLEEALGESGEYEQKVVRPVARAIAHRLKITGFMGYTTNREMLAFKDAVRTLLAYLSERGVSLEDTQMSEIKRNHLINEIATQVKEHFLPSSRGCCTKSCQSFASFVQAEVTPHQINSAASAIADKVVQNLKQHKSSAVQMGLLSSSQSGMSPPASPTLPVEDITVASMS